MDISLVIGLILLFTFIVVPYMLYGFDRYRVPASLGASVRDNLFNATGGVAAIALLDWFDPRPDSPHVFLMLGFLVGAVLKVAFDGYMLHRERLRGSL